MASDLYSRVVRPLAFSLRPERAHEVGKTLYRRERLWQAVRRPSDDDPRLRTMLGPIELQNPVGLAAGFDKNSEMIATMRA
ncbi:MAG TPA: hypothetical protein VHG52_14695, partial [Thermomicrobiales bacterium]|nr:hypothetical protein [Thermomicrobiales bacterium]